MTDIIDVSKYQKTINWRQVPYDTAIIRVGYRGGRTGAIEADPYAAANLVNARAAGKRIGIYFFTQAVTIDEAREEADYACDRAGKLDLPVYVDSEYSNKNHTGRADRLSRDARTVCVVAFCTRVMERGFKAGVYASQDWFRHQLDYSKLSSYSIWVARYSEQVPSYPPKYDLWQYTSQGQCSGITERFDLSHPYGKTESAKPQKKVVLIAQASKGETGIRGQIAGNQNGKELNIRDYYEHPKGWRGFRHPEAMVCARIAYAALRAVQNPRIGYDQGDRNSLYIASQKYGFDPGEVKIDVECDCTSLTRVCCAYAGVKLPDYNSATMPAVLIKAGFSEIGLDDLRPGDLLCTKTKGHACIVVQS